MGFDLDFDFSGGVDSFGKIKWSILKDHLKVIHSAASNNIEIKAALLETDVNLDAFTNS